MKEILKRFADKKSPAIEIRDLKEEVRRVEEQTFNAILTAQLKAEIIALKTECNRLYKLVSKIKKVSQELADSTNSQYIDNMSQYPENYSRLRLGHIDILGKIKDAERGK